MSNTEDNASPSSDGSAPDLTNFGSEMNDARDLLYPHYHMSYEDIDFFPNYNSIPQDDTINVQDGFVDAIDQSVQWTGDLPCEAQENVPELMPGTHNSLQECMSNNDQFQNLLLLTQRIPKRRGTHSNKVEKTGASKALPCPVCGKIYKAEYSLRRHFTEKHAVERVHFCHSCVSHSWPRKDARDSHQKTCLDRGFNPAWLSIKCVRTISS
ncbi:hypothetical protein EDC01DRAFT_653571 [Geopyxis carbonaria]|nr:hypothetical protein EDC01DRAFT_653571 [Geopyxis carbonaria]